MGNLLPCCSPPGASSPISENWTPIAQFDRPDLQQGVVQAFRRPENNQETLKLKLHGLKATAKYELENLDGGTETHLGRELMDDELLVKLAQKPEAAVIVYKLVR